MIDSHCHIYRAEFDADRDDVIRRAASAGVTHLLTTGCSLSESRAAVDLADEIDGIFAAVGVHPHEAQTMAVRDLDALLELSAHPKVLAYGEIGLDFAYDISPRDVQKRVFAQQLECVGSLDMPIIFHSRDAESDTLELLRAFPIPRRGQAHCFTGSQNMADTLLDLGFFLSFTGIITFKNADDLRAVVRRTPIDRILIETDSPYLAPVPHRGKRNEPCHVALVCRAIAELKGMDAEDVARHTSENFATLFGGAALRQGRLGVH